LTTIPSVDIGDEKFVSLEGSLALPVLPRKATWNDLPLGSGPLQSWFVAFGLHVVSAPAKVHLALPEVRKAISSRDIHA